jgi:asparagine synthase (glutamine-hydrolysing)
MRGLLPDVVRLNQTKGLQAADLGYRVVAHAAEIQAVLQRLRGSGLARQVLDLDKMTAVLDSLQRGVTRANSSDGGTILLRGLMSGLFLLRFD